MNAVLKLNDTKMLSQSKEEDFIVDTSRIILIDKKVSMMCHMWRLCRLRVRKPITTNLSQLVNLSHYGCQSGQKCEKLQNRNDAKQGTEIRGRKLHVVHCFFCYHCKENVKAYKVVKREKVFHKSEYPAGAIWWWRKRLPGSKCGEETKDAERSAREIRQHKYTQAHTMNTTQAHMQIGYNHTHYWLT